MKMGLILMIAGIVMTIVGAVMTFKGKASEPKPVPQVAQIQEPQEPTALEPAQMPQQPQETEPVPEAESEQTTPDPKEIGNSFEGHVADILKAASCRLLEWNQGTTSPEGTYAENELNPDFLVEMPARNSELRYWIECKYRSKLPREGFSLEEYQAKRYQRIQGQTKKKIVIALGVGGSPDAPEHFYIIPLDTVAKFKRIGHKYLPNYKLQSPRADFAPHMSDWFFEEVFNRKNKSK